MKSNHFQKGVGITVFLLAFIMFISCKEEKKSEEAAASDELTVASADPFFDLSLAQWSMHRMIREDGADPYSFAEKASEWGFSGLEYVSQLYDEELKASGYSEDAMAAFIEKSNAAAEKYGLKNVLIMIDGQGDLAATDKKVREEAIKNHYKWVDAAAAMGCHSIRVNLSGSEDPEEWMANSVAGLSGLATYAKDKNINILVENHGGLSSNAEKLAQVMKEVNMENCGTLPDFGNFCITRNYADDGSWTCEEQYDIYKGIEELMPYAKAVSAKSHDFDEEGNEVEIDYTRVLRIVKDAGYTGYIGVEYEGDGLGEVEGIMATKDLLLKAAKNLQ